MKIGMTSLTFRNDGISKVFEYAKKAGIQGIEWGISEKHIKIGDGESVELVKRLSKENGIEILSLGSYCDMTDFNESITILETAQNLNAPIIRLWAGNKASDVCNKDEYNLIVENTRKLADMAEKLSIKLCFEYHAYTLTDSADEAVKLAKTINKDNVGLYWQPQGQLGYEQNKEAFEKVKPYVLKNIHLNNYCEETGYGYLSDIFENLCGYFIHDNDYNFIVEFVKDSSVESLIADANTIRKIFS